MWPSRSKTTPTPPRAATRAGRPCCATCGLTSRRWRAASLQYLFMIAMLRGLLVEKHPNQAVVDTAGVGYDVAIPVSTYSHLPDAGSEVRLYVHTHVRED